MKTTPRPTLAELVPGYVALGITKRNAVFYCVDSHMRSVIARGKGRKAARREADMLTHRMQTRGLTFAASTRRMQLQRNAQLAAEAATEHAELRTEGRTLRPGRTNFHE